MRLLHGGANPGLSVVLVLAGALSLSGLLQAAPRETGLNELVILHPDLDKDGLPTLELNDEGDGMTVDIAPTVHIHRYYYTRDKEYQGPMVSGGPTIVAAKHPKTDEWIYVQVEMPAGAPVIEYTKHCITYAFAHERVLISYSHLFSGKVSVRHLAGRGARRNARDRRKERRQEVRRHLQGSRLVGAVKDATKQAADLALGTAGTAQELAASAVEISMGAITSFPGIKTLQGAASDRFQREHDERLRQATIFAEERTADVKKNL